MYLSDTALNHDILIHWNWKVCVESEVCFFKMSETMLFEQCECYEENRHLYVCIFVRR